ncbi:4Fe-4S binding protein [Natrarchaeobaculum sulfurireducens]|uniref:Ferredoxin n=1 Tax=Natrarchaeobaculum sulfurireducens TaxID=2044521 RepID=A0A346PRS8_9EURY|nr:4Fe-4S binding protein [Natrarchaeobaculum sulfurireducens]AXR82223.1 Ferredoxin [Natrarchaeobaculum sulfurireducens]
MTSLALFCDAGTSLDRRAVADAFEGRSITGSSLESVLETATDTASGEPCDRVAIVSTAARNPTHERDRFEADLRAAGVEYVAWIDPRLGRGRSDDERGRIVAAATDAALTLAPESSTERPDPDEDRVVVVGDPALASDLATALPVALVTPEPLGRRLPDVSPVRGRALDLLEGDGGEITVLVDRDGATDRLAADQIVWPGYDGPLADRFDVHAEARGAVSAVARVARERARAPVAVDASRCTVGRRGTAGCRACEVVCPHDAVAISSDGDGSVTIDADACTDCGVCLGACPTEAITSPRAPSLGRLGKATRSALETVSSGGSRLPFVGSDPEPVVIAFTARSVLPAVVEAAVDGPPTVPIPVPNAGRVPAAQLLGTVAAGAGGVAVVADPDEAAAAVDEPTEAARATLEDLAGDAPVERVASADPATVAATLEAVARDEPLVDDPDPILAHGTTASALSAGAVDALTDGPQTGVSVPALGSISVDADACTLCGACDNLCPTGAIVQHGADALSVDPAACTGCGICVVCPEDAIEVDETVDVPLGDRHRAVEPDGIVCERCGDRFASAAGVEHVRDALDGTSASSLELECCPACRRSSILG